MSDLVVIPDHFRRYGDASAEMAAQVASTCAVDQAATAAAVVPVFGLIGQDFLMAFACAQANLLSSVADLAGVHSATAVASHHGADSYDGTERTSARSLRATGR
jgi:hypothetical protein